MKFKDLRKTLIETKYIVKVVSLGCESEIVGITRYTIDYLGETSKEFGITLELLDSFNPLRVKFVGTALGVLEITLENKA